MRPRTAGVTACGSRTLPLSCAAGGPSFGYIDATHRVHARVEDGIRTGKDCGIGRFPSHDFAMNSAWLAAALIAATLLFLRWAARP